MNEITIEIGQTKSLRFEPVDSRQNIIPGTFSSEDTPVWTINNSAMLVGEVIDLGNTLKITGGPSTGDAIVTVNAAVSMLPRGPYKKTEGSCAVHVVAPTIAGLRITEKA